MTRGQYKRRRKQLQVGRKVLFTELDIPFFTNYYKWYFEHDPRIMSMQTDLPEVACEWLFEHQLQGTERGARDTLMRICGAMKIDPQKFTKGYLNGNA